MEVGKKGSWKEMYLGRKEVGKRGSWEERQLERKVLGKKEVRKRGRRKAWKQKACQDINLPDRLNILQSDEP